MSKNKDCLGKKIMDVMNYFSSEKSRSLAQFKPEPKYKAVPPYKLSKFPELNFIDFQVIQNQKPIKLCTYRFKPKLDPEHPKALIISFHGMRQVQDTCAHIAEQFAEKGYCVVGYDYRGQGRSEGMRGFIEDLNTHLQDAKDFIALMKKMYGNEMPIFLSGLSLGGLTTYLLTLDQPNQFKGSIMYAPALKLNEADFLLQLVTILAKVAPNKELLDPMMSKFKTSKNPDVIEDNWNNEFIQNRYPMKPSLVKILIDGSQIATNSFERYECPFVIIQGGVDKLVNSDQAQELMMKSKSKIKKLIFRENMWHEIYQEPEIKDIVPEIINWVDEVMKK